MSQAEGGTPPQGYAHLCAATLFLILGTIAAFALHNGIRPATATVVALMLPIAIWGGWGPRITRLNLLPRMMVLLYAVPFSALLGYLVYPDYLWVFTARGFAIGQDRTVMSILALTGFVGLCGLIAGMHFVAGLSTSPGASKVEQIEKVALGKMMFIALAAAALGLSALSSMPETLFKTAYGSHADPVANKVNFNAAFLVSYVLFVLLWIDIEREADRFTKKWKFIVLGVAFAYVIVVLQVLRGDRDSSGLIAAFAALYLTTPTVTGLVPSRAVIRARIRRLSLPLIGLILVFVALGKAREDVVEVSSRLTIGQMIRLGFSQNTWTAVLWTNLGTAWEYNQGLIRYRMGSTYRDYVLSLPPGIVAQAYGYERPLEASRGLLSQEDPAGVSMGGLHVVITSFKNFGAGGVLLVLFAYGAAISLAELANASYRFLPRLLWASIFCASFLWFWYGDMSMIRGLMAAFLLSVVYRLALSSHYVFRQAVERTVPSQMPHTPINA